MMRNIKYIAHGTLSRLSLSIVLVLFLTVFPVLAQADDTQSIAQDKKLTCPDLAQDATAAEQVICWYQMAKKDTPECTVQNDEISPCITQTHAWCTDASLDKEPVVISCFFAALRAGQLKEAREFAGYLRSPINTVEACVAKIKQASIRIVTNPAGGEVFVNGRSYGYAPLEVKLVRNWWESEIKARFATDPEMIEVPASPAELLNTFDREECVFGDLVITGPKREPPTVQLDHNSGLEEKQLPIDSSDSDWLLWTSISLTVAGIASGVAATLFYLDGESDFDYLREECPPPGCYRNDPDIDASISDMESKYHIGNILAVVGSVFVVGAVTTGVFYFTGDDIDDKNKTQLRIGLTHMELRGRY